MKKWRIGVVVLAAIVLTIFIGKDIVMKVTFNAKSFSSSSKTTKFRMSLDLTSKKLFIGSPAEMAQGNLGTPDHSDPYSISYAINEPLGWRDTLTLTISNGIVTGVYIHD